MKLLRKISRPTTHIAFGQIPGSIGEKWVVTTIVLKVAKAVDRMSIIIEAPVRDCLHRLWKPRHRPQDHQMSVGVFADFQSRWNRPADRSSSISDLFRGLILGPCYIKSLRLL